MSTSTLTMQRPEFVSVDNTYICVYCKQVLIGPLQTRCGHRICTPCLDDLFKKNESVSCPAKEEECYVLKKDEMCKDFSARRAITNLEVYCPNKKYGCQHTMSWKEFLNDPKHLNSCTFQPSKCANEDCSFVGDRQQIQSHLSECPFQKMICSNCNKTILLREESFTEHLNKCTNQQMNCHYSAFGCDFTGNDVSVKKHSKESLHHHISLLAIYVRKLEVAFLNIQKDVKENSRENARLESLINENFSGLLAKMAILDKYAETELENKKKFVNLSEMFIAHNFEFRKFKDDVQRQLHNGQNIGTNQNINTLIEQILEQTSVHDREIGVHDVRLAEMDTRFTSMEIPCYDGNFVWKITNYSKLKANAKNLKQVSLYSPPFYSSRYGYKMCGRLYPNGDGEGKGTHMSFFFALMKGEYDNTLKWPFQYRVTLTLVDQVDGTKNLSDHFVAQANSISFNKPTSQMNIATGCPCFISQQQLDEAPFLIEDTIFLKIEVSNKQA